MVVCDKKIMHLTCTCQMFEFEGILCRHLLLVLRNTRINYLPLTYILQRWCKDAKKGAVIDNNRDGIIVTNHDARATRHREIHNNCNILAEHGCTSKENTELMNKLIHKTLDGLKH